MKNFSLNKEILHLNKSKGGGSWIKIFSAVNIGFSLLKRRKLRHKKCYTHQVINKWGTGRKDQQQKLKY